MHLKNISRFFVSQKKDDVFLFNQETIKHIKVLRLKPSSIIYCIFEKEIYECRLENYQAKILKKLTCNHELSFRLGLAVGLVVYKKAKLIVQKATELGVQDLYFFQSEFSQKHQYKKDVLQKIAFEAAQQSFRNCVPKVNDVISFSELTALPYKNRYLAYERATDLLWNPTNKKDYLLIIGSEGGFSEKEIAIAQKNFFKIVSLGKRILRTETAAIASIAKISLTFI